VTHRIIVDEKRWIGGLRFLPALSYCTLLSGPEAQQFATYIGWLMHRTPGGLVASGLFVLPGAGQYRPLCGDRRSAWSALPRPGGPNSPAATAMPRPRGRRDDLDLATCVVCGVVLRLFNLT
jgi:hypothetical protein